MVMKRRLLYACFALDAVFTQENGTSILYPVPSNRTTAAVL